MLEFLWSKLIRNVGQLSKFWTKIEISDETLNFAQIIKNLILPRFYQFVNNYRSLLTRNPRLTTSNRFI